MPDWCQLVQLMAIELADGYFLATDLDVVLGIGRDLGDGDDKTPVNADELVLRQHFLYRADGFFHHQWFLPCANDTAIILQAFHIHDLIQLYPNHFPVDSKI